mgnify:CR=1 FL=1
METLETIKLDKMQELARYRRRTDAKPYVVNKLREQIAALENCVDLNDSKVDNQLLRCIRPYMSKIVLMS